MDATIHGADPGLLAWLTSSGIRYELHEHAEAFTARGAAITEGVDPHRYVKVVAVEADAGERLLFVLEASDRVDLHKAKVILGARGVRLLPEPELMEVVPSSEPGALPAVGKPYGLPVIADEAIRGLPDVMFSAGSRHLSVKLDRREWEQAAGIVYADLAQDEDELPAWARS